MVHELAHMWFGDSVSPYEWSDLWLNEGHATWYQFIFAAENGELEENIGIADFTDLMQIIYFLGDHLPRRRSGRSRSRSSGEPAQLFSRSSYYGGALVLYALRQQVGDATFQKIERAWVTRYRDGRRRRPTSSLSPRRSPTRTCTRSCTRGCTTPRRRRCRATRTGRWIRPTRPRGRRHATAPKELRILPKR